MNLENGSRTAVSRGTLFAGRHNTEGRSTGKEFWSSGRLEICFFSQADLSLNRYLLISYMTPGKLLKLG